MNHLISQEWREIGFRNFVHMLFDAKALECDTFKFVGASKTLQSQVHLDIVQFQKERYSRIQETEPFRLMPVPEKSET
jgi:hypothetical protein